ncbi:DNA (cytosine-5)-methyltransferase 1 [Chishuiella changwenlii]|uniref:Cytosine-specific methyltransferase n=1 Tax=Chishuiella changwenlii TaxID=1434701 RepID=A0A1M7A292_9FLAO|nr:DNA cytosine methyltransferase [Chishuiella changwenlii]GGE91847.1 restriction endonuclease subunit M [Chishuiella changwenlii]SHL36871.1 DNA (cytosine-5)-methyltransferase 1 [Chishuiella changwenlii]
MKELNYIDLFAGAGGLSEGFIRAGFKPIAHVEMNKDACDTLRTRTAFHWLKDNGRMEEYYDYLKGKITRNELWEKVPANLIKSVINKEISPETLPYIFDEIDKELKNNTIDLIIGGPPCQAYSVAGRVRKDMTNDPRNHLYKHYVKFLIKYQPKMFVFENVPGILTAKNGHYLQLIFEAVREAGYELDKRVLNAQDFGVLQNRKRVIIIGWKKNFKLEYPDFNKVEVQFEIGKHLFSDLPKIKSGQGNWGVSQYEKKTNNYLDSFGIRNGIDFTTQHISRFNNENDLEIYRIAVNKWVNEGKRLNYGELPTRLIKHNNIKTFTNRFQVVNHKGVSHTVVAHICADGHYYIHPDISQNRSITVREAARIQSFPDDYFFESNRTAAFKQIGNAVPVLMGEGIAKKIKNILKSNQ